MKKAEENQKIDDELTLDNIEKEGEASANKEADTNVQSSDSELQQQLQKFQQEIAEAKDKYLRLYSEFENFRRRTAKEKLELVQSAGEQLIRELLPILDDFERAESAVASIDSKELQGFLLISNKLKKMLEKNGVKPMALGSGSDFDADTQEAISQIPVNDDTLKGKVVDVVEKGYQINDKVIRHAKVVVGN